MWMGTLSAIAAMVVGALFAALTALHFSWGQVNWVTMLTAALLLTGGFRTLRKMSGGLRLLAGAWGVAAGVMMTPYAYVEGIARNADTYAVDIVPLVAVLIKALPFIALAGLALTVLHKESK